jgi:hypothetical protein
MGRRFARLCRSGAGGGGLTISEGIFRS